MSAASRRNSGPCRQDTDLWGVRRHALGRESTPAPDRRGPASPELSGGPGRGRAPRGGTLPVRRMISSQLRNKACSRVVIYCGPIVSTVRPSAGMPSRMLARAVTRDSACAKSAMATRSRGAACPRSRPFPTRLLSALRSARSANADRCDGPEHLVMSRLVFMRRLVILVPRPSLDLIGRPASRLSQATASGRDHRFAVDVDSSHWVGRGPNDRSSIR